MGLRKYFLAEHPIRLAHRGSTILWPENTMAAFQGAVGLDCRYIETDLHMTRDGVLVIFHDDRLERLTNGRGWIKDWLWPDLRVLDAAYHFKPGQGYPFREKGITIPSLEEAMSTFPGSMFNIDLKQPGIEPVVADFIQQRGYQDRVLIASFKDNRVRKCRRLLKNLTATSAGSFETAVFWACSRVRKSFPASADALQVPVRQGKLTVVDEKLIKAAHASDIQVHVWTVNDPGEMRRLLDLGVDGLITDRIDLLNRIIFE